MENSTKLIENKGFEYIREQVQFSNVTLNPRRAGLDS
jgi:hypothetical protein